MVEKSVRGFEYLIPTSVDEAIAMRRDCGEHAHFLAGGTELVVMMKQHKLEPQFLIELSRIESLQFLHPHEGGLSIGPMTTHAEIESSPFLQGPWRALAEASAFIREPQIKNLGTIGGNVAYAVPSADLVPPLLTFGALLKLRGPEGERMVPINEFLVAPYRTALGAAEVLAGIRLPETGKDFGSAFCKLARFHGLGLSVVSVAAALRFQGGR
ncbi:MAG: FAD binding domain-containing protein, partial [Deltaproteobacteria bacterium]|nr:FAD binding domain-containing protein [Deltaproteobacteria bacterium]